MRGQLSHFGSFSVPFPLLTAIQNTPQLFTTIHHTGENGNARLTLGTFSRRREEPAPSEAFRSQLP